MFPHLHGRRGARHWRNPNPRPHKSKARAMSRLSSIDTLGRPATRVNARMTTSVSTAIMTRLHFFCDRFFHFDYSFGAAVVFETTDHVFQLRGRKRPQRAQ